MLLKPNKYILISHERYEDISSKYMQFIDALNNVDKEPVQVFQPLSPKILAELQLIREVSKDLQKKKEDDMMKAAQAASETEELTKKKNEDVVEAQKDK